MSPGNIAAELLDRVSAPELLVSQVESHFKPYLCKCKLDYQEILIEYCMHLMNSTVHDSSFGFGWIPRFHILFECLESSESKLDLALEFMRRVPIPWSQESDVIIQAMLTQNTLKRHLDIVEQYRLMNLKKTIQNYGIQNFNISDLSLAKGFPPFIYLILKEY